MTDFLPFTADHLDAAAELLAERHRIDRKREPLLPARFEDAAECRPGLEKVLESPHSGVVAVRDGQVRGYLLAKFVTWGAFRAAETGLRGSVLADGEDSEMLREMYAEAAPRWFREGYFLHVASAMVQDIETIGTWYSLGFGQAGFHCSRDTSPVPGHEAEVVIRRAGVDDLDRIQTLQLGLGRYNAGSAIFRPFIMPTPDEIKQWRGRIEEALSKEDNSYWIAYLDERPVGLMIWQPQFDADALDQPEGSIYLSIGFVEEDARTAGIGTAMVNRGFEWVREKGFKLCTVGFFSTNIIGARFWRSKGFQPLAMNLERRIDERIAWANGKRA